jgi:DNA/RNA-binding domain of Phe-tRNA-synthetase-like protein
MQIVLTERWREAYPGAMLGVLAMRRLVNPNLDTALQDRVAVLQAQVRTRFAGLNRAQLIAIPTLQAYATYYKRFGKTYHVQLQLESVLFKGKSVTGPSAIVQAMFIAELKNQLLTAGHDLETVQGDIVVDVSLGTEGYTMLNGGEQTLKAGDMFIRDQESILSSILYGPDQRTRDHPRDERRCLHCLRAAWHPPGRTRDASI